MCDEVHVAGFKYDAKNRNGTLHYYGNETMATMEKVGPWIEQVLL